MARKRREEASSSAEGDEDVCGEQQLGGPEELLAPGARPFPRNSDQVSTSSTVVFDGTGRRTPAALDARDRYVRRALYKSRCASGAGHEPWDRAKRATAIDETAIAADLARFVTLIMSRGLDSGVCFRMATASASESM